jgi:hypothetical protein
MEFSTRAISSVVALASVSIWSAQPTHASSLGNVLTLSKRCRTGKADACRELTKIAMKDKDYTVREAAVKELTDQPTLAQIALEDSDYGVRMSAVQKLNDQAALARVALAGVSHGEKEKAVMRRRMNGIALACRIYHAFGQPMAGSA